MALPADEPTSLAAPEAFPTPGVLTIEALAGPAYGIPPHRQLKTLVYLADDQPIVAVIQGDHLLNEAKLQTAAGARRTRPAQPDEVFALLGAHPGSLGAVRFSRAPVLVDQALAGRTNLVTGANRDGFHLRGVDVARDLLSGPHARFADLRLVTAGQGCPRCDGVLHSFPALEVGHIFKLGTRYSAQFGATVLDAAGAEVPLVMGSYGIGVGRLLAAIVERHHDVNGISWPLAVAPYAATVLRLGDEDEVAPLADEAIGKLEAAGFDVLYDDRDERPGVKFKDADLIGIPLRVVVGRRGLADRTVECKRRGEPTGTVVPIDDLAQRARELLTVDSASPRAAQPRW
ncbi:MAG: His/Gly/Thr/Pro-type tRNA ligase C-terminal domain-containing protein [Chloroflexota bacterium]|nr:His/Gly/Thr/Pro-type tRNA ligase C-terminal domain-containing protein [Chloroflexota bacterium]